MGQGQQKVFVFVKDQTAQLQDRSAATPDRKTKAKRLDHTTARLHDRRQELKKVFVLVKVKKAVINNRWL